jgi:predicted amidophosphoribosyltransferase
MLSTFRRSLTWLPGRLLPGRPSGALRAAGAHLLWPWRCPLCGEAPYGGESQGLCAACARAVDEERVKASCPGCGSVGRSFEPGADMCPACMFRPRAFAAIAVVGVHQGALRQLILRWKFGRRSGLEAMVGGMLSDAIAGQPWRDRIDGLVPIPQPWSRWLSRQFFPVGDLAERVGVRLGIPVWPILWARRHRPQVGLDMQQRIRNVKGVFRVRTNVDVKDMQLCLIDDVTTTGATLEAAAAALGRAGAGRVYAAVLAKSGG